MSILNNPNKKFITTSSGAKYKSFKHKTKLFVSEDDTGHVDFYLSFIDSNFEIEDISKVFNVYKSVPSHVQINRQIVGNEKETAKNITTMLDNVRLVNLKLLTPTYSKQLKMLIEDLQQAYLFTSSD